MKEMEFSEWKRLHFIGIGGIGMSALARYFVQKGVKVSGYDLTATELTKQMESEGMDIHYVPQPKAVVEELDAVIYTPAVPLDHEELNRARQLGLPLYKRAEVLGMVSKNSFTIAVAGTHGKTTTSAMIAYVLNHRQNFCSAFIGGILSDWKSNFQGGTSDVVVVEADEYDRSFLHLTPDVLVVNSLDSDHLDIYESGGNMIEAYKQLISQVKKGGHLLLTAEVYGALGEQWLSERDVTVEVLGHTFEMSNVRIQDYRMAWDLHFAQADNVDNLKIKLPGEHNIANASMAVRVARLMGYGDSVIREALTAFNGIHRRFEYLIEEENVVYIDDYAHHPVEIKKTVDTLIELYPNRHKLGIFQPHLYSRTRDFYREFAVALEVLDEVWLLPLYPAREKPIEGVDSRLIYNNMRTYHKQLLTHGEMKDKLATIPHNSVVITLGAGDIDKHYKEIIYILAKNFIYN